MHTINVFQQLFTYSYMRKISFLLLFSICAVFVSAQLSVTGNHLLIGKKIGKDSVTVILFDSINSDTRISYNGTNVTFHSYDATSITTDLFPPDNATGYIINVDDVPTDTIWVIDYKKHLPTLTSIEPDIQSSEPCLELNLLINANIPNLSYKTVSGNSYDLPRNFTVKYPTLKWDTDKWMTDTLSYPITLPKNQLTVTAPLCNTEFKLIGDQYAQLFGINTIYKTSSVYPAVAVECHLKAIVSDRTRSPNNEADAPTSKATDISFSVPIDIQFLSNANEPVATYFNWSIYKDGQLIINRNDSEHRYTFTDYGTYKVKVIVRNSSCSYSDSITINAYEAAIQVPNVFTPNSDGQNDEFRVAYKSLLGFECWVYNRWGRKVYYWNDPQKGWDGKIGGVDAAEGPYFYVIKATGYGLDPKKHDPKVKSTITLKGDINLLRGSKK